VGIVRFWLFWVGLVVALLFFVFLLLGGFFVGGGLWVLLFFPLWSLPVLLLMQLLLLPCLTFFQQISPLEQFSVQPFFSFFLLCSLTLGLARLDNPLSVSSHFVMYSFSP